VKERKKALNLKNYQINMQAGGIPSPNEDEEGSGECMELRLGNYPVNIGVRYIVYIVYIYIYSCIDII